MAKQHLITPPPELVQQWLEDSPEDDELGISDYIATQAANWGYQWGYQQGADAELEACIEWLGDAPVVYNDNGDLHPGSYLRDARRPEPLSLKKQALEALEEDRADMSTWNYHLVRSALESLPS